MLSFNTESDIYNCICPKSLLNMDTDIQLHELPKYFLKISCEKNKDYNIFEM